MTWVVVSASTALSMPGRVLASETTAEPMTTTELLERAAEVHSGARAELSRADVANLESDAFARSLPPLNVSLGVSLLPTETRNGAIRGTASLRQRLPTFAERRARGREAGAASVVAECSAAWQRQNARLHVAQLLVNLAAAAEERAAVEALVATGDETFEVVEAMARTGSATVSSLASIQLKLVRWREQLRSIDSTVSALEGRLVTTLQLSDTAVDSTWATAFVNELDEASRRAETSVPPALPRLNALEAGADRAALQAEVAEAENRPDYTLWISWSWVDDSGRFEAMTPRGGRDILMAGVSIGVPLERASTARRAEASRARSSALMSEWEQDRRDIEEAIHTLSATVSDRYHRAQVWEDDALALSAERIASEVDAAAVGHGDFAAVYQALEDYEELILETVGFRHEARLALLELTALTNGNAGATGIFPVEDCADAGETSGSSHEPRALATTPTSDGGAE